MKSTITFNQDALIEWCLTGSLDFGFVCNPKNFGERWITLEEEVCFTDVNLRSESARIDWEIFSNIILAARTRPQLVLEGSFFTFQIPTALKDYPTGYKSMVYGHVSPGLADVFSEVPFTNLCVCNAVAV